MLETLIQGVVPEPINAQGTNDSLFLISVSCLFFIYRQYTQLHHAFFCNPIWYVLRHWSAGSGPFRTRHGCETKLSSGETTVLALWGFRSSDGISTDS